MGRKPFPEYQDRCGWNALLPKRQPREAARGSIEADHVIVGAGYTGIAAARQLRLLDPHSTIVVLEATEIGEGSSARNSGFASSYEARFNLSDAQLPSAVTLSACLEEGFNFLTDAMAEGGFSCDLEQSGRITGAATDLGAEKLKTLSARAKALGVPHQLLDRATLVKRIGTEYYQCGLAIDQGHLLQPAALIRGLADTMDHTIQLFENSPMLSLEKGSGWRVKTPHAEIHAKNVVLATNAAIKDFGYWGDRLVTIYTFAGLTEEMSADDASLLGGNPWGLLPAHRLGTTIRRVGGNRFLVRSLYSYERPLGHAEVVDELTAIFHRRYPLLSRVRLEYVWGGTTALTMNGAPRWGVITDGLYGAAGCNGSGIVKGTLLGKRLADMIVTGHPQDDLETIYGQANRVAPEPFRTIGFHVISALERRKAGLER